MSGRGPRRVAMQKSIFTRYLGITMGIVVLSFIMLGTVMMAFFSSIGGTRRRTCSPKTPTPSRTCPVCFSPKPARTAISCKPPC